MSSELQTKFARIHLFFGIKYIRLPHNTLICSSKGLDLLATSLVVTSSDRVVLLEVSSGEVYQKKGMLNLYDLIGLLLINSCHYIFKGLCFIRGLEVIIFIRRRTWSVLYFLPVDELLSVYPFSLFPANTLNTVILSTNCCTCVPAQNSNQ